MLTSPYLDDNIRQLKKEIAHLEWDIKTIPNKKVKDIKMEKLKALKEEFARLLQQRGGEHQ
ncbi:TPA: hypothetical protein HA361_00200 [Candidatus Woesearchaeota archaeon]|nr:hypothetical protein [Candidatus Woesearchaeota archaeon]